MGIKWTNDEIELLKFYYLEKGLSLSELSIYFPNRTEDAIHIKITRMKLVHSEEQKKAVCIRRSSGEKNGMYGKEIWNKGKTKYDDVRLLKSGEKISLIRIKMYKDGLINNSGEKNGMYGKEPWCKGKTKYDDVRLLKSGEKGSKTSKKNWADLPQDIKDIRIKKLITSANKNKLNTKIELIVHNVLIDMGINFTPQYKLSNFIFDFYLSDYNLIIECQGDYWHGNEKFFKNLNNTQIQNINRDIKKKDFLENNNINYLFLWENEIHRDKKILDSIINNKILECKYPSSK